VTGLGSGFNLTTTAEGVETPEQLARLRREGFGEIQGYLYARPMPASETLDFIDRNHPDTRRERLARAS
jgi:EAL domain-containing protein (putative c-di-GMP-specific phosphodiesterase class I)